MKQNLRVKKEESIVVVIDIQEKLYPLIGENEILTKNIVKLIKGLKILEIPVIVTQQYTKGLGDTINPVKEAIGDFSHIEKMSFSCCGDPQFIEALKKANKKNVIIMGIESHVCVLQTVLDLIENGYRPILVEDCVGSRNPNDKKFAVKRMSKAGAIISTCESLLFELTVMSGTEQFRAISKIIK